MYFDPSGSIEQRKAFMKRIEALSPTARKTNFTKLDNATFQVIEGVALKEARHNALNSGRLFPTTYRDRGGREITEYEGDISAAYAPFLLGSQICLIDKHPGTHEETVRLRAGERLQVVRA